MRGAWGCPRGRGRWRWRQGRGTAAAKLGVRLTGGVCEGRGAVCWQRTVEGGTGSVGGRETGWCHATMGGGAAGWCDKVAFKHSKILASEHPSIPCTHYFLGSHLETSSMLPISLQISVHHICASAAATSGCHCWCYI